MSGDTPERAVRGSPAQTTRTLLELRDLILTGRLPAGERLSELALVQALGASRTPVRSALQTLCDEGLLDALPGGGYGVRRFNARDIHDAIELRGTLEGLAARLAAERGVEQALLDSIRRDLDAIDRLVERPRVSRSDFSEFVEYNGRFHEKLIQCAGSEMLARQIERATRLPFASPNGFVMAQATLPQAHRILTIAQDHHRSVIDAITRHEGTRAEALMREHARLAHRNLELALHDAKAIRQVAGNALIIHGA
jgi:GntR family transcriptional regulator of vanillate catabolism